MLFSKRFLCAVFLGFWLILPHVSFSVVFQSDQASGLSSALVVEDISSNTTWTVDSSPYIIVNDTVVESGVMLAIDAGVNIRFDGNYSLIVYGSLKALGTASDPIVFTSNKPQPSPGDWNAIKFLGAQNETMILTNVVVEYGKNGIIVQSMGGTRIEASVMRHNSDSGVYVVGRSNLSIRGSVVEYNEKGVLTSGESVSGIGIFDCTFQFNGEGIHVEAWATRGAAISNISIVGNVVSRNGRGVYFYIWAGFFDYDVSRIYDVLISGNYVGYNDYGVYVYSGGPWYGSVYRSFIVRNRVFSNRVGIYVSANLHYSGSVFDLLLSENVVAESSDSGIYVSGGVQRPIEEGVRVNLTGNSVSRNGLGVVFDGDTVSVARLNDVYDNVCGMNVTNEAMVNAESNFWGTASGPFHAWLNSEGTGDSVNGDGVDLDFLPFLSSPVAGVRPWAVLEADKSQAGVNEAIVFDGSKSSDGGRIKGYLFDFGDGSNSGWVSGPTVAHAYVQDGEYVVSLSAFYEIGFESDNSAILTVSVLPTLVVSVVLGVDEVGGGEDLLVDVHVSDGSGSVSGVSVVFFSSGGGSFLPQAGETDSGGDFVVRFTAPLVVEERVVEVFVNASKDGYASGVGRGQVVVFPRGSGVWWGYVAAAVVVVAVVLFGIVLWSRKKRAK